MKSHEHDRSRRPGEGKWRVLLTHEFNESIVYYFDKLLARADALKYGISEAVSCHASF